jgi:hypothetical protein
LYLARTPLAGMLQNIYAVTHAKMEGNVSKQQVIFSKKGYQNRAANPKNKKSMLHELCFFLRQCLCF